MSASTIARSNCKIYMVGLSVQCERCNQWIPVTHAGRPPNCAACVRDTFNTPTTVCPHCGQITPDGSHCQICYYSMYESNGNEGPHTAVADERAEASFRTLFEGEGGYP